MTRKLYPSDVGDKLLLRLPDGLRPTIKDRAKAHRRSMNSEVIVLLEAALAEKSNPATGGEFGDMTPAAGPNETADQGGPITHGL